MRLVVPFLHHLVAEDLSRQLVDPVLAVVLVVLVVLVVPVVPVVPVVHVPALVVRVLVAAPAVLQLEVALAVAQAAVVAVAVASVVVLAAVLVVAPVAPVVLVALPEHAAVLVDVVVHHSVALVASVAIWKSSSRPRCRFISLRTHRSLKARSSSNVDQQHETLVRNSTEPAETLFASCSCKGQRSRLLSL